MAGELERDTKKWQLPLQTMDLIAAFMIWVILSTLLPFIKQDIPLDSAVSAWIVAIPVILGSSLRIPFGYLAGRYGARIVYVVSFVILLAPILCISQASTPLHLIIGGIVLGVAGAVFSIGVTSLPRYYPKERQGFVNGVYGIGNVGTALTTFGAPAIATFFDWRVAVQCYLVLALLMVITNLVIGDRNERKLISPITTQLKAIIGSVLLWAFSLFYFITFGAFVAFTMVMPDFLASNFTLDGLGAGISTGIFIVFAAGFRVVGGWLADRHDCYRLLMIVFAGMAVGALVLAVMPPLPSFLASMYLISICCGLGNGIVYKLVPTVFPNQVGVANGFVAMMGGFGGFFPPLVLSFCLTQSGSYFLGFILYLGGILSCLVVTAIVRRSTVR